MSAARQHAVHQDDPLTGEASDVDGCVGCPAELERDGAVSDEGGEELVGAIHRREGRRGRTGRRPARCQGGSHDKKSAGRAG